MHAEGSRTAAHAAFGLASPVNRAGCCAFCDLEKKHWLDDDKIAVARIYSKLRVSVRSKPHQPVGALTWEGLGGQVLLGSAAAQVPALQEAAHRGPARNGGGRVGRGNQ